jgi:hypothetical protein
MSAERSLEPYRDSEGRPQHGPSSLWEKVVARVRAYPWPHRNNVLAATFVTLLLGGLVTAINVGMCRATSSPTSPSMKLDEQCRQSCHMIGSSFKGRTDQGCFCMSGTFANFAEAPRGVPK